jgi:cellulose synthase/poly-beta-1,6-N-acetylglucosamine synthase-like glycosyltransferase
LENLGVSEIIHLLEAIRCLADLLIFLSLYFILTAILWLLERISDYKQDKFSATVVAARNEENNILRCLNLRNLISQRQIEIILVDDNSTTIQERSL